MINKIKQHPQILWILGIILLIPALLINLGKLNIFMAVDEATRGLVALEMMLSDNFITSTINGEFYYNKPPLYPWILIVFFKSFGISEFVLRLPTVISLLGFGYTVYWFVSRELGKQAGIITAFALITSGRILFWESLLGYIDTSFSWVIYLMIMSVFFFMKKQKYLHLFLISYFLMTLGFMLKGLPAIVFQGITLLAAFAMQKQFKKLFTWQHFAGGMVFLALAGTYYTIYNQYNSLENVFVRLWTESAQRTVVDQGFTLTFKHLLLFPFEMLYHYMPWTLLLLFTLVPGFWKTLAAQPFLKFNLLIALFNILPYWTSPDVYPKYIMMLVPMFFTVFVFFYLQSKNTEGRLSRALEWLFIGASLLLTLGYIALPFLPQLSEMEGVIWKSGLLFLLSAFIVFLLWKIPGQRLLIFALVLIVARMAFGWFVWPQRAAQFERFEQDAIEVAQITADEPVYYYQAEMLQYGASYVMTREKQDIIRQEKGEPRPGIFYITDDAGLNSIRAENDSLRVYFSYPNAQDGRNLNLVKIIE